MKISALFSQSFHSIWNNKVRSSLTILGIVIGVAAVIALVGLGKGLQSNVTTSIGGLGATEITVRSQDPERQTATRQDSPGPGGGGARVFMFGGGNTQSLTQEDYQRIKDTTNITSASPEDSAQVDVTLTADATEATAYQLYGVDNEYVDVKKLELDQGSFLTKEQVQNSEKVAVIGSEVATELFTDNANPVGQKLYLKGEEFTVIGVLKAPENPSPINNPAQNIYTGYKKWLSLNEKEKLGTITATAKSEEVVENTAEGIEKALLAAHGITDETKADINVSTGKDLLETLNDVSSSFTSTLTGIAAISLVVGGIGIMNIMLVVVTERTREIGLRRAIGAKSRHILTQFLIEAVLLTLIGGGIGSLLGILFGTQAGKLFQLIPGGRGQEITAVVDLGTIILAVGVSVAIGIVFGLFPALKASRLDPVEALRYE